MVAKRATPICVRCLLNPTSTVAHTVCDPCWEDVERAMAWTRDPSLFKTWNPEGVKA